MTEIPEKLMKILQKDYPWFGGVENSMDYLKRVREIQGLISQLERDTTLDETYKTNLLVNAGLRLNSIINQISRLQQRQIQTLKAQQLQLENIQTQNTIRTNSLTRVSTKRAVSDDDSDDDDAMEIEGLTSLMSNTTLKSRRTGESLGRNNRHSDSDDEGQRRYPLTKSQEDLYAS